MKIPPGASDPFDPPDELTTRAVSLSSWKGSKLTLDFLEDLANKIRDLWIQAVRNYLSTQKSKIVNYSSSPRWDGGIDAQGKKHKSIWPGIALYVSTNNIDPQALIQAQFEKRAGPLPAPTILKSQLGLANYKNYKVDIVPELKKAYEQQKLAARMALYSARAIYSDNKRAYISILYDIDLPMTPLFRYCLAVDMQLPEIAGYWNRLALEQYLSEPGCYDEVWKEAIPSELRTEAQRLLRSLSSVRQGASEDDPT